jgi:hypothetical protein
MPGALGLRADHVRQTRSATTYDDLEVAFTLANGTGGKPAPLVDALFQVKTADGILHTGTQYESTWWVDGTAPDGMSSLAGGYSVQLRVGFPIGSATPVELTYAIPGQMGVGDGRSVSAPLTLEPCAPCADQCTYLDRDPRNCGACGTNATVQGAQCVNGVARCMDPTQTVCSWGCVDLAAQGLTVCNGQCVDLASDDNNCGACGNKVTLMGVTCSNGAPACSASTKTLCGSACVDVKSDDANCGACGNACNTSQGMHCGVYSDMRGSAPGHCAMLVHVDSSAAGQTCSGICASSGLTCDSSGPQYARYGADPTASCTQDDPNDCTTVILSADSESALGCPLQPLQYVDCRCMK